MDIKGPDQIFDMDSLKKIQIKKKPVMQALMVVVVLILVFSSFYRIEPEQVGIILRFGRFTRTTEPGLHAKMPIIETVTKVRVQRQLKEEFGFRTEAPGIRTTYSPISFEGESSMLSGDLNVAMVEWIVQYRITDPYKYLFKVRSVTETFRDMNEAVMRAVVGDRTITEILTEGRMEIESASKEQLQELCNLYETGITIDQLVLQDVNPPDPFAAGPGLLRPRRA